MSTQPRIRLERVEKISGTDAMAIGWAAMAELALSENFSNDQLLEWDNNAILAYLEGVNEPPVGVILWKFQEWNRSIWINLGFVIPSERMKGVYRLMWVELIRIAEEKKARGIQGGTSVHNHDMIAVMEKLGRTARTITFTFEMPKREIEN